MRSAAALAAALGRGAGCAVGGVLDGLLGCVGGGPAVADRQNSRRVQGVIPAIGFIIFGLDDRVRRDLRDRTESNTNNLSS
ncbi:hypothetical protein [Kitasatospora kifunensis]|uniref:Uncharacterized protein n=1 Tax=Kitasatospora kifunensis TaxID=58351 RepID=A0A7W7R568_KITKI|nr:hypothetical protein [Kitasatospora kifunensis]MBB4925596.1 hypothetical protein [Kitasatospora kifunensis]